MDKDLEKTQGNTCHCDCVAVLPISRIFDHYPLRANYRPLRIMPAENWQNSVLFLVSFMHVWYVDKEMEQNLRNCPP